MVRLLAQSFAIYQSLEKLVNFLWLSGFYLSSSSTYTEKNKPLWVPKVFSLTIVAHHYASSTLHFSVSAVVCCFLLMPQRTLDSQLVSKDLDVGHSR